MIGLVGRRQGDEDEEEGYVSHLDRLQDDTETLFYLGCTNFIFLSLSFELKTNRNHDG